MAARSGVMLAGPEGPTSVCDNAVVDAFKLILLNYSNFSIAKIVVNKIERVK